MPKPGIEPGTSDTGLKTKKAIYENAVHLFDQNLLTDFNDFEYQTLEDTKLPNLQFYRKSKQNCDHESAAFENIQNGRYDVIEATFSKSEKSVISEF